jgi:hypothetical protein
VMNQVRICMRDELSALTCPPALDLDTWTPALGPCPWPPQACVMNQVRICMRDELSVNLQPKTNNNLTTT